MGDYQMLVLRFPQRISGLKACATRRCRIVVVGLSFTGTPGSTTPFVVLFFFHGEDQVALLLINPAGTDG